MQTAVIEYYPPIVARIREIRQIARAEDIEFAKLRGRMTSAVDNLFIFTADEEGISRLEKTLNITADKKQKIEDRKLYILSVLNRKKMSLSEVEKLLNNYAKVKLSINRDTNRLEAEVSNAVSNIKLIYKILDGYMPLNVSMEFGMEASAVTQFSGPHSTLEMETDVNVRGTFKNAWFLDGTVKLDGSRLLDVDLCPQPICMGLETAIKIPAVEADDAELTAAKDLWFLDGTVKLDGSRLLDAELRKEEI